MSKSVYTVYEDAEMLRFLERELKRRNPDAKNPKGNKIWELASKEKVTKHSVQSMRDHARRALLPTLAWAPVPLETRRFLLEKYADCVDSRSTTPSVNGSAQDEEEENVQIIDDEEEGIIPAPRKRPRHHIFLELEDDDEEEVNDFLRNGNPQMRNANQAMPTEVEQAVVEPIEVEPEATEKNEVEPIEEEPVEEAPAATEPIKVEPIEEIPVDEELPAESITLEPDAQEMLGTESPTMQPTATEPPATEPTAGEPPTTERDESLCSSDEDFQSASGGSPDRNSIDHPMWQRFIAGAVVEDNAAFERKLRWLAALREHYNVDFAEMRDILLQLRQEKSQVDLMTIEVTLWKKHNAAQLKKSKESKE